MVSSAGQKIIASTCSSISQEVDNEFWSVKRIYREKYLQKSCKKLVWETVPDLFLIFKKHFI